ncbi:MAG: DUF4124 domain-containing protein [Thiotrichaceae bacterium]|nr:DUF4124 domain-containing protein [Thiotrichaceae bacterium]
MLISMKYILLKSLLVSTILFTAIADAQLYKGLDAEGNVVYSDQPFENAEKFTPASLSVVNIPKRAPKPGKVTADEAEVKAFKYTDFDIASPKNNETIWDNPQLAVTLRLKPDLNTEEEHTLWLLMDGKVIVKNSQSTTMQIGRLERGAHQLQAQVRDNAGKVMVRSRPVVVHIKNTSVPRKSPR